MAEKATEAKLHGSVVLCRQESTRASAAEAQYIASNLSSREALDHLLSPQELQDFLRIAFIGGIQGTYHCVVELP